MKKLFFLLLPFANANIPPNCFITNPVNNQYVIAGSTVTVKATATDIDGTIKKVEFYKDGIVFRTENQAPFTAAITNIQPGVYSFKAMATDNLGAVKTSTSVTVFVFRDYQKSIDSLKFINASLQALIYTQSRNDSIIIDILQKQISDLQNSKPIPNDSLKNLVNLVHIIGGDVLIAKLEVLDLKDSIVKVQREVRDSVTFSFNYPLRAVYDSAKKVLDIKLADR